MAGFVYESSVTNVSQRIILSCADLCSDSTSQHSSISFTDALHEAGVASQSGLVDDVLDNTLIESGVGLCEAELTDLTDRSRRDA